MLVVNNNSIKMGACAGKEEPPKKSKRPNSSGKQASPRGDYKENKPVAKVQNTNDTEVGPSPKL